jgi:hypothetical protein
MELKLPPIASPALDDLPPDFDEVDLIAAVPTRPAAARPMAKESVKKVVLRGSYGPPPPPPQKKKVVLRGSYSSPPPPPQKKVVLGALHGASPPTSGNKVTFPVRRSPPPVGPPR